MRLIIFGLIGALIMGARNQMNFADVMRWAFMPNVTHVENTDVPDLAPWVSPLWKLTASALLLLAVAHGVHGLVVIADDYIVSARGQADCPHLEYCVHAVNERHWSVYYLDFVNI